MRTKKEGLVTAVAGKDYNFSGGSTLSPGPSLLSKLRRVEGKREAPGDGSNARCL